MHANDPRVDRAAISRDKKGRDACCVVRGRGSRVQLSLGLLLSTAGCLFEPSLYPATNGIPASYVTQSYTKASGTSHLFPNSTGPSERLDFSRCV